MARDTAGIGLFSTYTTKKRPIPLLENPLTIRAAALLTIFLYIIIDKVVVSNLAEGLTITGLNNIFYCWYRSYCESA